RVRASLDAAGVDATEARAAFVVGAADLTRLGFAHLAVRRRAGVEIATARHFVGVGAAVARAAVGGGVTLLAARATTFVERATKHAHLVGRAVVPAALGIFHAGLARGVAHRGERRARAVLAPTVAAVGVVFACTGAGEARGLEAFAWSASA